MAKQTIEAEEFYRRVRQSARERDAVVTELFKLHYVEFVSRLVYKGVPRQLAEEQTSNIFMGLRRNCESISASTRPIHYLNRAVSNAIADFHARKGAWTNASGIPPETVAESPTGAAVSSNASAGSVTSGASVVVRLDDESAPDIADPDLTNRPEYELERRQNCAVRAWRRFERENPAESEVLAAYSLDEMDIEEARASMGAKSLQAARQRMFTWRARLKALCRELCGDEHCEDGPVLRGSDGKR